MWFVVLIRRCDILRAQGSTRKQNEDRFFAQVGLQGGPGDIQAFAACYDGHGGRAVSEWLEAEFFGIVKVAFACMETGRLRWRRLMPLEEILLQIM